MCEPGDTFRFCTCADDEELRRPRWVLRRRDTSLKPHRKRGRVAMPTRDDYELETEASILQALRDGGCFDFEYTPLDGDVLIAELEIGRRPIKRSSLYRFRYGRGPSAKMRWHVDSSNALTPWRNQMVQTGVGPIECE